MGNFLKELGQNIMDPAGVVTGGGLSSGKYGEGAQFIADPMDLTGRRAGEAAASATAATLQGQREQLDYLREINKLPMEYRDKALTQLYGAYAGTPEEQQIAIERAKESPLYQELMGGRASGEESIARHAAATGGLRSGNIQANLYDYNTQLEKQALSEAYGQQMQGLKGLAMIPTDEQQIGQSMRDIGLTTGLGITAQQQAQQSGVEQGAGLGMGILSMFI